MHDVVVIGAGPAGLLAAHTLATRGHDVLVVEEHQAVGYPVHCTGVIGLEAFDEFDLPRDSLLAVLKSARFSAGSTGRSVTIDSDDLNGAIVDRAAFDQRLAARARESGVAIRMGVRAEQLAVLSDSVRVTLAGGQNLKARACVLACGANYRFQRQMGLGSPRLYLRSAQAEIPFPSRAHVEICFGRGVAPGGFAWVVPFSRGSVPHVRIGLMCEADARVHFREFCRQLARESGIDGAALESPRVKIIPLSPVKKTYGDRVLAVGDAAGLVKPTTGGGVYYGLLTGRLAGEVLAERLSTDALDETSLQAYERRWRERLGPEIRAGLAFRAIASRLNDRAIDGLIELARVDGIVPLLKKTANFNWHGRAVLELLRNPSFRRIALTSLLG